MAPWVLLKVVTHYFLTKLQLTLLSFFLELFSGSVADFKTLLTELWFGLYDRDGTSKDVMGSR